VDKHEVAKVLDEMGLLLEMTGENPFKIRAYHVAARTIEGLDVDLQQLVKRGKLEELPGIGESIAQKITSLVETGRLPSYEKLKKSIPSALLEMLDIPGLGAKKIKTLHEKLKIDSKKDLLKACQEGKIAKLAGFGKKSQQNILDGIAKTQDYSRRTLWWNAAAIGESILERLSRLKSVKKVEIAGSLRRKLETVGDLDFLVASDTAEPIMRWFTEQSGVERVLSKGPTKASVRLKEGMQADIRIVPPNQFSFALLYFTGSKEHNIKMRRQAHEWGWLLNEYGLKPLAGKRAKPIPKHMSSEAAIFKAFGLSYIPPELREDQGEIEAAEKGKLPTLVEESDIRGAFHCHTTDSDGHNTLEEMAKAAEQMHWEYVGISDHSKSSFQAHGMDEERLFQQMAKIKKLNQSKRFKLHLFAGLECDILTNGKLDFPDRVLKELDFVIVSIHRSFNLDEKTMTARLIRAIENPHTTMVGHVTGRLLLKRDPYKVNITKVIDACIANHKIIELNAHPMRLDMDWRLWHKARDKGLKCSINPDAHHSGDLEYVRAGVNIARKGWLEKGDIINTLPLSRVKRLLKSLGDGA
jgi:DNA polymerase (family 10)